MDEKENKDTLSILRIPTDTEQLGLTLFRQQMWCWGQDIKREEGNLLLSYGFTRARPPEGEEGSSSYLLKLGDQRNLMVWAFGLVYVRPKIGGIFLKRMHFLPQLLPTADVLIKTWKLGHLPETALPRTLEQGRVACLLLSDALHWLSSYEQWIRSTFGLEYRQHCLEEWGEPYLPAEMMSAEWEHLAGLCQSFLPGAA